MTLEEIRGLRSTAEKQIADILKNYQRQTELIVDNLIMEKIGDDCGVPLFFTITIESKL